MGNSQQFHVICSIPEMYQFVNDKNITPDNFIGRSFLCHHTSTTYTVQLHTSKQNEQIRIHHNLFVDFCKQYLNVPYFIETIHNDDYTPTEIKIIVHKATIPDSLEETYMLK